MKSYRLKRNGTGRRTRKSNIKKYLKPKEVLDKLFLGEWKYKTNREFYHIRDRALGALLYLTSGRINEVLQLTKDQFEEYKEDKDFIIIKDFWVSKRAGDRVKTIPIPIKDEHGNIVRYGAEKKFFQGSEHPHPEIPLPRVGDLAPFTKLVEEYLSSVGEGKKLFPFGTARAWQIINTITGGGEDSKEGLWNHWFRAQSLSYQVNLLRSTTIVAKDRGIANPKTIEHYYVSTWKEHKDEFKKRRV